MNPDVLEMAKELASRPYPFRVYKDNESDVEIMYLAENPDLEGCMAQGGSQNEAIHSLAEARVDYISFLLERGLPVPEPSQIVPSTPNMSSHGSFKLLNVRSGDTSAIENVLNSSLIAHIIQPEEREFLYEASLETSSPHHSED